MVAVASVRVAAVAAPSIDREDNVDDVSLIHLWLTHSLTHCRYTLTHSLTHSITHTLTHSLTHLTPIVWADIVWADGCSPTGMAI